MRQSGFSVIELLCGVAVILTLCAIAARHYLKSREAAQEAVAASNMRVIATAEAAFAASHQENVYAPLSLLGPEGENLIDSELAGGAKQGYSFHVLLKDDQRAYSIIGLPKDRCEIGLVLDNMGRFQREACSEIEPQTAAQRGGSPR